MVPETQPNAQITMRMLPHETGFREVGGWREFALPEVGLAATVVCAGCAMVAVGRIELTAAIGEIEVANSTVEALSLVMGILIPGTWKNCSRGRTRPKQRMLRQRINRQRA